MPVQDTCPHVKDFVKQVDKPKKLVCPECVAMGSTWVHLRQCLDCGHVGCCDSSPNRHARAHYNSTSHPIIRSVEPREDWKWCYIDEVYLQ